MRKLIFASLLLACGTVLVAQTNLQLHYDFGKDRNFVTTTVERFKPDKYGSLFYFIDFNHSENGPTETYWEIVRYKIYRFNKKELTRNLHNIPFP